MNLEEMDRNALAVSGLQGREAHHIHGGYGSCKLFSGKALFPGGMQRFHLFAWDWPAR
jgi:hypothetical protein